MVRSFKDICKWEIHTINYCTGIVFEVKLSMIVLRMSSGRKNIVLCNKEEKSLIHSNQNARISNQNLFAESLNWKCNILDLFSASYRESSTIMFFFFFFFLNIDSVWNICKPLQVQCNKLPSSVDSSSINMIWRRYNQRSSKYLKSRK